MKVSMRKMRLVKAFLGMALLAGASCVCGASLPKACPPVRVGHPRLFFNAETWPALEAAARGAAKEDCRRLLRRCDRYTDNPVCSGTEGVSPDWSPAVPLPPINEFGPQAAECALAWRFTHEAKYLEKAKKMLLANVAGYAESYRNRRAVNWYCTTRVLSLCAYDWIHEGLTDDERRAIIVPLVQHCDDVQAGKGKPRIVRQNSGGKQTGFYGSSALPWYAGVAAVGDGLCDELAAKLLQMGYTRMVEMLDFRADSAEDDGVLSTGVLGYAMGQYPFAHFNFFHTLKSATGVDAGALYPGLALFPNFVWWNWIKGERHPQQFGFGDTTHADNLLTMGSLYTHLTQYAFFFADSNPEAARLAATLRMALEPKPLGSEWPMYPFLLASGRPVQPYAAGVLEKSPLRARFFESSGQLFMRSGWQRGATYALFTVGGKVKMHRHYDDGNFVIYKRGFQALDSGSRAAQTDHNLTYYYAQTVAHNCVLVHKPNEPLPGYWGLKYKGPEGKFCDGGQTVVAAATALAFETNPLFTYVAADLTPSYRGKCATCTRQFLYLGEDCFVVYDRVAATQADYAKEWLLHTEQEPTVEANLVSARADNGALFCRTLLPTEARLEKIGGPGKEYWSNGRNWPLDEKYVARAGRTCAKLNEGPWFGQWRVSVRPAAVAAEDRFLHVINVSGEAATAKPVAAQLISSSAREGARVTIPDTALDGLKGTLEAEVFFNRADKVGGAIAWRLVDAEGKAVASGQHDFTEKVTPQAGVFCRGE